MKFKSYLPAAVACACLAASPASALVFNLIPEANTPQFAIDGFTAAANRWSSVITDNITVNVQIGFADLGLFIIGQAGSDAREFTYSDTKNALSNRRTSAADFSSVAALQTGSSYTRLINHTSNNPNGANSATPYLSTMDRVGMTTANAKALGLLGPTTTVDGLIRFNSTFGFDFNPADGIGAGLFDFVGAATHELGHTLGFSSGVDDIDQLNGIYSDDTFSSNLIDLFRFSANSIALGAGVTDYTADNRDKYFSIDGGVTSTALFANGVVYGDGNQASHWKDSLGLGIMDPTAFPGELMVVRPNDTLALDVLGYTLAVPEPTAGALLVIGGAILLGRRLR